MAVECSSYSFKSISDKMPRVCSVRQLLVGLCTAAVLLLVTMVVHIPPRYDLPTQVQATAETKIPKVKEIFLRTKVKLPTNMDTNQVPTNMDTNQPGPDGVCTGSRWQAGVVPLYIITPTYPRAEQIPELTRTGQTLLHIDNLVWIVAEDAPYKTKAVIDYLDASSLCYVYLRSQMPAKFKKSKTKPRGVANRNAGLKWIRTFAKKGGVLYFADDDNTYDIRLFEEIRRTKKVSMFPVGLVTKLGVSSPIVRKGKVVGYYDGWISNRKFPIDMAGFAVNVEHFLKYPGAVMPFIPGREETKFIEQLDVTNDDIEPLVENCRKILVWHTRTFKNAPVKPISKSMHASHSNIELLQATLWKGKR